MKPFSNPLRRPYRNEPLEEQPSASWDSSINGWGLGFWALGFRVLWGFGFRARTSLDPSIDILAMPPLPLLPNHRRAETELLSSSTQYV